MATAVSTPDAPATGSRFTQPAWRRRQMPIVFAWILIVVLFVIVSLFEPGFRSNANIRSIIDQSMILGVVALGFLWLVTRRATAGVPGRRQAFVELPSSGQLATPMLTVTDTG